MSAERVREYLLSHGVHYEVTQHPQVYTAQEAAAAEHVSGHVYAKPVMVMADHELVMMVLPASQRLDLSKARTVLGYREVRLAEETEFSFRFPDCETGAEPPFGNLYDIPLYVDKRLAGTQIVCDAGSHGEAIRLDFEDYVRIAHPIEVDVAVGA